MKRMMYYVFIFTISVFSLAMSGCSDDDNVTKENENTGEDIIEGPSSADNLTIPSDASFLGDSIQQMTRYSLASHSIEEVVVTTTQNGHISVLGGYKDESVVYIYAKPDDDENLSDQQVKSILEKYYSVESHADDAKIRVDIKEKKGVAHGPDFCSLRISVNVFTPQFVSTALNVARGSIIVNNVHGNQHVATLTSGAIKYINSSGKKITAKSENGFVGIINTTASEMVDSQIGKGNILIALNKDAKAKLYLQSLTKVNAYILNNSNFQGTVTNKKVEGQLNQGGSDIKAISGLGVINLKWYEEGEEY